MTTPLNLLVAFPYMKPDVVEQIRKLRHARILVDSGAFTAWKAGKSVDLDEYCRFIEALGDLPWRYFMLDVVGDPAATMKNYEIMLKRGFNPIPIFTRGEDPSVLEDYYKTSDVVGVGGLVGTRGNRGFVKGIMEKVGKRKVHWLGFSSRPFIQYYKPYMCDSSSWVSSLRYGSLTIVGPRLSEVRVKRTDFDKIPSKEVFDLFRWYEEDIRKMTIRKEWSNSGVGDLCLEKIAAKSAVRRVIDIESIYGTKFFLAVVCVWQVRLMSWGHDFWNGIKRDHASSPHA
jgi:hypothetical protein